MERQIDGPDNGQRTTDNGCRMPDTGYRIPDMAAVHRMPYAVHRMPPSKGQTAAFLALGLLQSGLAARTVQKVF